MLTVTPRQVLELLSKYDPDEHLLITWWAQDDVEQVLPEAELNNAHDIWEGIIDTLDNNTSDHVISYVNEEMDDLIAEQLKEKTNG